MLSVLRHRTYRRLFAAQVVALLGTGLATVALGLLAYELAGSDAAAVLGAALALKMVAYVVVAPAAGALAGRIPRRALLVSADLVRTAAALALPFVTELWQVYALIVLLQAASATFTPVFQATVPDVLPEERAYTEALSLSRLAYDLESLASPALAAALLAVIPYGWLFAGTGVGFLASAVLVVSVVLPGVPRAAGSGARAASRGRFGCGVRLFLATPRLRALLALDLAVAAAGAMVLVGTVTLVRDTLGRPAADVPIALGAYGAGSMVLALVLPRLLDRVDERRLMLGAACVLPGALGTLALGLAVRPAGLSWPGLLAVWVLVGAATSAVLTPSGRLLRRSAGAADLPAAFAAQFSLSHACWLLAYPLAGRLTARSGPALAAVLLAALALAATLVAARTWPRTDASENGGGDMPHRRSQALLTDPADPVRIRPPVPGRSGTRRPRRAGRPG
ncbi:MFS transporter [Streptomyces sp. NPDC085481]|uniref:MFS transporter n=1 Tax=Streptomyces sp. NPDC085481 TaxID=3365727 RepID=UPI0037D511EC